MIWRMEFLWTLLFISPGTHFKLYSRHVWWLEDRMGGDGVLNQEWDLYLFSICFSFPSSPWSLASDSIGGGGRSSPLMSFIFKKKKEWESVRLGFNFRNKAFTLPCPPCLWRQAPVDTRSWPLCSCIDSERSMMTLSPWWLEPHLCCPFQLGLFELTHS